MGKLFMICRCMRHISTSITIAPPIVQKLALFRAFCRVQNYKNQSFTLAVPEHVLSDLADKFGINVMELEQFGGGKVSSDGIVYKFTQQNEPMVFKIIHKRSDDNDAEYCVKERASFFSYLGSRGVDVVAPVVNKNGNMIEMCVNDKDCFLAYAYPYVSGIHPQPDKWNDEVMTAWGRVIGLAHKAAKEYEIWDGVTSQQTGKKLLTWSGEIDLFTDWCADEQVKAYWHQLRLRVEELTFDRNNGGFIHNDPHMQNILWENGRVKLLDFDVANCHFFACDIAIAIQSVMFTTAGGMDRPVDNKEALEDFVRILLKGYCKENDLQSNSLEQIELFIFYRRALLFTVMQEWLVMQPKKYSAWKKLILDEEPIIKKLIL